MKQTNLIIGPFETKNGIGLIGLDNKKLHLISLDFWALIKYSISIQLPIFTQHIDKLKNNKLNELINRYKTIDVNYTDLSDIQVKKNNWKNYICIEYDNKIIKWNILNPIETEKYEKIAKSLIMNNFC
jgi:hypothetical protein